MICRMAPSEHVEDMKRIVAETSNSELTRRWAYYSGRHPQVYATQKLQRSFASLVNSMTENYCGLAINTRVQRLQVTGWNGPNADQAEGLWAASRLPQRQDRLWRWALAYGHAYVLLSKSGDELRLYPSPPTLTAALPDPTDPYEMRVAGQVVTEQSTSLQISRTITLYYADRTFTYRGRGDDYRSYDLLEEYTGLGVVPAVRVAPFGDGQALVDAIAPSQDRINKLASNKLVAAEYGAFRQRVFFTRQEISDGDLRNLPDSAIVLDPDDGQASVQEMSATDLANYDQSKDAEINGLFSIASLPRHMRVNPGALPSGEALKADEGPLVESVLDAQREMGEGIVDLLTLLGLDAEPQWRNPEVRNELYDADVVSRYSQTGVPWEIPARLFAGWSDDDIAEAQAAQIPTGVEPGTDLFG